MTETHALEAADAVAPGGTLLIVLHAGWPSWQTEPPFPARFPTLAEVPEQLALPEGEWTVVVQETVRSPHASPDGVQGHRDNHVWRFRRR